MSVAAVHDTHAAVKRLQGHGFEVGQAEAIVAEVNRHSIESLASKSHVSELKSDSKTDNSIPSYQRLRHPAPVHRIVAWRVRASITPRR